MTEAEMNLRGSDRCILFQNIATAVWERIIRAHDVGVNLREEGITYDILVDLLQYSKNRITNFDIYAKPGYDENKYGSDLDVFVETSKNQYRWFALQAKILKSNNRYTTLRDGNSPTNPTYQWDKLKMLEAVSGCKSFYLLYNGKFRPHNYPFNETDSCNDGNDKTYTEDQLGCSLVSVTDIERLGLRRNSTNTRFINPKYEDIHPKLSEPWKKLVCCLLDKVDGTLYAKEEIKNSNPKFRPISEISSIESEDKLDFDKESNLNYDSSENKDNRITTASKEAKWDPSFRIVISRSDNL